MPTFSLRAKISRGIDAILAGLPEIDIQNLARAVDLAGGANWLGDILVTAARLTPDERERLVEELAKVIMGPTAKARTLRAKTIRGIDAALAGLPAIDILNLGGALEATGGADWLRELLVAVGRLTPAERKTLVHELEKLTGPALRIA